MSRERYQIADLELDVAAARVERRGEPLHVTGLSFDLLVVLARRAPDVVSHESLAEEVWKLQVVSDETIMQRVTLLRRALEDDAGKPRYVRSVRGKGYGLVPDVRAAAPRSSTRWRWVVLAAVLVALSVWTFGRRDEGGGTVAEVSTKPLGADDLIRQADEYRARHRRSDNETAIELYERGLELAPEHPRGLVGLSFALSQRASKFNYSAQEAAHALELAEQRLGAEPRDAAAHYARAFALDCLGRIGPAIDAYLRSAALDPENLAAVADAAYLRMVRGELAGALQANLEVLATGQRLHYLELEIGWTLALLDFQSAAEVWLQRAVDRWPDNIFAGSTLARFRLHAGRLKEAERAAADVVDRGVVRPEPPTILGHVALLRGEREAALERYREATAISARMHPAAQRLLVLESAPESALRARVNGLHKDYAEGAEWPPAAIDEAALHVGLGDLDAALAALDRAIELGYRESDWLMLDPMFSALREHPGFVGRIERLALLVEEERQKVLNATWLPANFLEPEGVRD